MTEIIIESLTLKSIGLFVLGCGLLVTHLWNRRKSSNDSNVVSINGIIESLLAFIFRIKSLLIGIGFITGAIICGIKDYEGSVMNRNIQLLEETLSFVESSKSLSEKRDAVRFMEMTISLSVLQKQNKKSMEEWYSSNKNLTTVWGNVNEPICVQLLRIYRAVYRFDKIEKLERVCIEFYKDYWGESDYNNSNTMLRLTRNIQIQDSTMEYHK